MVDVIDNDYEVSSEGGGQHWPVLRTRLEYPAGLPTNPAAVLSQLGTSSGTEATGTILSLSKDGLSAEIDFSTNMVYRHSVRNVVTYSAGDEYTFAAIHQGDVIFYDRSSTMPAGVHLSLSPCDENGYANPIFGIRVKESQDDPCADAGGATASTQEVAVMQLGIASAAVINSLCN